MAPLLFVLLALQAPPADYVRAGNPDDIETKTRGGFALLGGGKDVETAFRWLIARSGGGDFLVLRAAGTAAYNPFVMRLGGVNSAATLILKTREQSADPLVLDKIRRAEAIFLAGGDQWNYIRLWKDTPLAGALQERIDAGVPVGGTSAGLAVLGDHFFSAERDTITSEQAMADPFDERITLGTGFLKIPAMAGTITDSHFTPRSRMGRLVTFLARLGEVRGIGIDERTALLLEPDGQAMVAGENQVWFLNKTLAPKQCEPGKALVLRGVEVQHLKPGQRFDLRKWNGEGSRLELNAGQGSITTSQ